MVNVTTYPAIAYAGRTPGVAAISATRNANPRFVYPPGSEPVCVPFNIDWTVSFNATPGSPANLGVVLDCTTYQSRFPFLKSVFINNKNNILPVTIFFADTGYQFSVQGGIQGWYPAFTRSVVATCFIEGMTASFTTYNFSTIVHMLNIDAVPFVDLPSGAPIIGNDFLVSGSYQYKNDGNPLTIALANPGTAGFMNIQNFSLIADPVTVNSATRSLNWTPLNYAASLATPTSTATTIYNYQNFNLRTAAAPITVTGDAFAGGQTIKLVAQLRYQYPVP